MKKHLATLAVVAAPIEAARLSGEERLAKLIEGRTAGKPESCISTNSSQSMTLIDKTAVIYKQGTKVWVNRTKNPQDIDDDDVLVIRKYGGSQLCRTDMVTLVDRSSGMFSGALFLEDFVPYTKAS